MMEPDDNRSEHRLSEDRETARVLRHASAPELPEGAMGRLLARLAEEPQEARAAHEAKIIAFAPRPRPRSGSGSLWRYAAAVPLAASLALGVWLGANGKMDFLMPSAVTGGVALNDDAPVDDLGGVGDAYAEEGTT